MVLSSRSWCEDGLRRALDELVALRAMYGADEGDEELTKSSRGRPHPRRSTTSRWRSPRTPYATTRTPLQTPFRTSRRWMRRSGSAAAGRPSASRFPRVPRAIAPDDRRGVRFEASRLGRFVAHAARGGRRRRSVGMGRRHPRRRRTGRRPGEERPRPVRIAVIQRRRRRRRWVRG